MLVLLRPANGVLYQLDFGEPTDVSREPAELVAWVLDDYDVRRDALWDLQPLVGVEELGRLLPELQDDPERLRSALLGLRFYAMASPLAHTVAGCLDHQDKSVRVAALGALGSMAVYPTTRHLGRFVVRQDVEEWHAAANALAKFGTEESIAMLKRRAAVDPEAEVYVERAEERREVIARDELNLIVVPTLNTENFEDLCIFSPMCAAQLTAVLALADLPELLRQRAARVLGVTRQRQAGPAALAAFQEPTASLSFKSTLAWLFGRIRHVLALPALYEALATANGRYELIVIESIGRIGRQSSLGVLLNHLDQHSEPDVVAALRAALWRISRPVEITDELWLRREGEATWLYALTDEGRVETDQPAPLLEARLSAEEPAVRRDAAFALGQLPRTQERVDLLRSLAAGDPDEVVRAVAARGVQAPAL